MVDLPTKSSINVKLSRERLSSAAFIALAVSGALASDALAHATFEVSADTKEEVSQVGKIASLLGLRLSYDQSSSGQWLLKLRTGVNITYCPT